MVRQPGLINFSRAGDFFHYMWVARRCLHFLNSGSDLTLVSVESVSVAEAGATAMAPGDTEDIIDVAEYFGGESPDEAREIHYSQLKHSEQQLDKPWTPATLAASLKGLYDKFIQSGEYQAAIKLRFISNRPVSPRTKVLFERLRRPTLITSDGPAWRRLKAYTGANTDAKLRSFLVHLELDDSWGNYREQQKALQHEAKTLSPGTDNTISAKLLEMISSKVMPDADSDIRKADLLRTLDTELDETLFPAPSRITYDHNLVQREQEEDFARLLSIGHSKVAIHAESGLGKTALAYSLNEQIEKPSASVLYDCYGNGEYRSQRRERFGSRIAFTQIANELASQGLCLPMVPNRNATDAELLNAFISRLGEAALNARSHDKSARIFILIDAADNAQMAAEEFGRSHSFARQLAGEVLPEGVTCVFFCWSSRLDLVDLPSTAVLAQLNEFTLAETAVNLRRKFSEASDEDVAEFHHLTSATPRVQAVGLFKDVTLSEMLIGFGPHPLTTEQAIRDLFETELQKLRDDLPPAHRLGIDRLCRALAALRPFIPIDVLSKVSKVPVNQIRNFARNIGRPLAIQNDAIQFFDEPSESWFRQSYAPSPEELNAFVDTLQPLAQDSAYVAAALPELLHRTGRDSELVDDILADRVLPDLDPAERRVIAIARMRYALKSALDDDRLEDAAKLAFKLAGETAGEERHSELLADQTHLYGTTLSSEAKVKYVARRPFQTDWHGGHFAYSAAFLSWDQQTIAEARTHLRVAMFWLEEWARRERLDPEGGELGNVSTKDATCMAVAWLNTGGVERFNRHVKGWFHKPRIHALSLKVCQQLADLGQWEQIHAIGESCTSHDLTRLAAVEVLFDNQMLVSKATAIHLKKRLRVLLRLGRDGPQMRRDQSAPPFVATAVAMAFQRYGLMPTETIAQTLDLFAPAKQDYVSVWGLSQTFLQKCSSLTYLQRSIEEDVTVNGLLSKDLEKAWGKKEEYYKHREDLDFYKLVDESILPWCELRADILLDNVDTKQSLSRAIELSKSTIGPSHSTPHRAQGYQGPIACLWVECLEWLQRDGTINEEHADVFKGWVRERQSAMYTPSLFKVAQICSRLPVLADFGYEVLGLIGPLLRNSDGGVESLIDGYIAAATAIYAADPCEADVYLERVAKVAVEVGQENVSRLLALLMLSIGASDENSDQGELAYRVARAAEHGYKFLVRDKHWARDYVISGIFSLSPNSAFAILARWRDRNFGGAWRLLRLAQRLLVKKSKLAPADAAVLIGFKCGWPFDQLIRPILPILEENSEARDEISKYLRFSDPASVAGISDTEWALITQGSVRPKPEESQTPLRLHVEDGDSVDADSVTGDILAGLDLTTPSGIDQGHARVEELLGFNGRHRFADLLFERVPPPERILRLQALVESDQCNAYWLPCYLDALPPHWFEVESFRQACSALLIETIHKHPENFDHFPYVEHAWVDVLENRLNLQAGRLFEVALKSRSSMVELLGPQALFGLVNLTSKVLDPPQARRVLDACLGILETQIDDDEADGPWHPSLSTEGIVEDSFAGYIWNTLSSPHRDDRWEAMHAVSLVIVLDRSTLLSGLLRRFETPLETAFRDQRYDPRNLSAEIAFLHVLRRGVILNWKLPADVGQRLLQYWKSDDTHLLKRWLSAEILLGLASNDQIELTDGVRRQLASVCDYGPPEVTPVSKHDEDRERHYFGHDLERWVNEMQKALGLDYFTVQSLVAAEMREHFDHERKPLGQPDPRQKDGVYRKRSTWDRKHAHPDAEDIDFYRTVHAIMHAAGKTVLESAAAPTDDGTRKVREWLTDYLPTDPSGLWKFDWRDPAPKITWEWVGTNEEEEPPNDIEWSRMMSKADLTTPLLPDGDISLRAQITLHSEAYRREAEIYVNSALVSPGRKARSLARALQSIDDPTDFRLPDANDTSFEIDLNGFTLTGVVDHRHWYSGIDTVDSWSGGITIPGLRFSDDITKRYGLIVDATQRVWRTSDGEKFGYVMRWGKTKDEEDARDKTGTALAICRESLLDLLKREDKWLVICRQVRRLRSNTRSRDWNDEDASPARSSVLIFLIDSNGDIHHV